MNSSCQSLMLFLCMAGPCVATAQTFAPQTQPPGTYVRHETKEAAMEAAGIARYQSEENIRITQAIADHSEAIKQQAGKHYAGHWIEYDRRYVAHLFVAVSGPVQLDPKNAPENGLTVVRVKYSEAELRAMSSDIFEKLNPANSDQEPLIFGIGIDTQINKLVVGGRLQNAGRIREALDRLGYGLDATRVEVQEGPVTLF